MHREVDLRQMETAVLDAVELPVVPLTEVLAKIAGDAKVAATEYLSETVVPHGGE